QRGDVPDHVLVEPAACGGPGLVGVPPAVAVGADRGDDLLVRARCRGHWLCRCAHLIPSAVRSRDGVRSVGTYVGTLVVQACAPPARVASRWTCTPSSREKAWVSASHSSGNCVATCCTGQLPWHSCTAGVPGTGRAVAA